VSAGRSLARASSLDHPAERPLESSHHDRRCPMLTVEEAIARRRSIRRFKPDPVPPDLVDKVLEAARLAPSGSNRQPWRFQVITDAALKQRLCEEGSIGQEHLGNAPLVIACGAEMLSYVKRHRLAPPGSEYYGAESEEWDHLKGFLGDANLDCAIAIAHLMLMAAALGLGTCWVRRLRFGQVGKILGWPRTMPVIALIPLGYPDESPEPRPRMSMEQMLVG
jgi:nitroreductase